LAIIIYKGYRGGVLLPHHFPLRKTWLKIISVHLGSFEYISVQGKAAAISHSLILTQCTISENLLI